uniref:Uncharacterized protein n=1 Tax=Aegilops tauschii subsp. strangulata TaxID=200361 RepID=A0A453H5B0_AEGTS
HMVKLRKHTRTQPRKKPNEALPRTLFLGAHKD